MFARLIKMPSLRRRQSTDLRQGLHDRIKLTIDGLLICLERELGFNWPHEVHIVVPRAEEIRTYHRMGSWWKKDGS